MPTDPIPTNPDFHTGYFVKHEADKLPPEDLTLIARDKNGVPCFACYFEAMFEAAPMQDVDLSQIDTDGLEADVAAYVVRAGATLGYLADSLADVMVRAVFEPANLVPIFAKRLAEAVDRAKAAQVEAGEEPLI
jgi:hypothetical protein